MNTNMPTAAAGLAAEQQADFIMKTYGHLFGAVLAFVLFEFWLFETGLLDKIAIAILSVSWLLALGGFILVGWLASIVAHTAKSTASQYAALGVFIVAEGIIFAPLLYLANNFAPGVIENAAIATIVGFVVLTAIVFTTRKNFSFLRPFMIWGGLAALAAIVFSVVAGSTMGLWFTVAMIVYAGGAVLYSTSNVLHEYGPGQHVAASMQLFASVALLFWYVIQLFMSFDD